MSFEKVRKKYGVPAKRGMRVIAYGEPGVLTSATGSYVRIRLDSLSFSRRYHPVHGISYLDEENNVILFNDIATARANYIRRVTA